MRIHRVKRGECVRDIARMYGVDEDILRMNNELLSDEPAIGEELLVITPTRTYVVRRGDSAERLALRFGIMRRELMAYNPWIEREGLVPSRRIALKYDERKYGAAAACGYLFGGGELAVLRERLPFITYAIVAAAVLEGGELRRTFDGRDAVGILRMADKIPLLRIFSKGYGELSEKESDELIEKMIYAAISGGYKGLTLGGEPMKKELLMQLRRRLMGSDLILFTEVEPTSEEYLCELADGNILTPSCVNGFSFGEALCDFAMRRESNRCMPELFSFARVGDRYIPVSEALRVARRGGCEIEYDGEGGVCRFTHKRSGEHVFPSLENIKATLDGIHEYGYMGISYDITRTPLSYLMTYGALFGSRAR